jgi:sugar/nucleoside kinase (ribokinase family)
VSASAVLVSGHATLDRLGDRFVPGGTVFYAGQAWRALGARVRVLTAAAPDLPAAALEGLEAEIQPSPRTTTFENVYGPDGKRTQRVEAFAPPIDPSRLPAGWRSPDVLHLGPLLGETPLAAFRETVSARVTGLCAQGLVRKVGPDGRVAQPRWEFDPAELGFLDVVCLGEDDVVGQGDLVARLAATVPIVAFTHGALGCDLIVRGRTRRVGIFPAREVDPTGAGDVFAAGLLLGLARGEDPVDAARLGAAAASIVIEARGGEALPRTGEAFARAERVPVVG